MKLQVSSQRTEKVKSENEKYKVKSEKFVILLIYYSLFTFNY